MTGWSGGKVGGTAATRSDADWREGARVPVGLAHCSGAMEPSSVTTPLLLALLLLTMQAGLSCAAVGATAAHDRPPDTNSTAPSPLAHLSRTYVGTAAHYSPSSTTPTACYGKDPGQFPSSNDFAAAGEGIWDNGVSCGRQYLVRCISASGACITKQTIQVPIIDRALTSPSLPSSKGATIVLSKTAFGKIAKPFATAINVEYQQI